MVILDEPYASPQLISWLRATGHPVLDNAFARACAPAGALNLVPADKAAAAIDAGGALYTNSENALEWIDEHVDNEGLRHSITFFKDKVAMRQALAEVDPGFFFRSATLQQLREMPFRELEEHLPFVVKPARGFCSMGVHTVRDEADWHAALADIEGQVESWAGMYPDAVVAGEDFILEGYITGQEFALDAFFDDAGCAHVLNVLRHDFAGPADTSDRLYVTSADIVGTHAKTFERWLSEINERIGARNVPVHAELRVSEDGRIRPIEFNALRFAGLGGTDVAEYAFGFRTFEAFLQNDLPDWDAAFSHAGNSAFAMSLLTPAGSISGEEAFDYEALGARFAHVLEMRRFEAQRFGCYGFLFLRLDDNEQGAAEADFILRSDLREFLHPASGADR